MGSWYCSNHSRKHSIFPLRCRSYSHFPFARRKLSFIWYWRQNTLHFCHRISRCCNGISTILAQDTFPFLVEKSTFNAGEIAECDTVALFHSPCLISNSLCKCTRGIRCNDVINGGTMVCSGFCLFRTLFLSPLFLSFHSPIPGKSFSRSSTPTCTITRLFVPLILRCVTIFKCERWTCVCVCVYKRVLCESLRLADCVRALSLCSFGLLLYFN